MGKSTKSGGGGGGRGTKYGGAAEGTGTATSAGAATPFGGAKAAYQKAVSDHQAAAATAEGKAAHAGQLASDAHYDQLHKNALAGLTGGKKATKTQTELAGYQAAKEQVGQIKSQLVGQEQAHAEQVTHAGAAQTAAGEMKAHAESQSEHAQADAAKAHADQLHAEATKAHAAAGKQLAEVKGVESGAAEEAALFQKKLDAQAKAKAAKAAAKAAKAAAPKPTPVVKDTTIYAAHADAHAATKEAVDQANALKAKSIAEGQAAAGAGTKAEQIAHLQAQKAITSEQLSHLENAKQAADQAHQLPGYKASQDQYDHSTVDIKIDNAKQIVAGIDQKIAALKGGKTVSESVTGPKPAAGQNTYAKQMPGKIAGSPYAAKHFESLSPEQAVAQATGIAPSSAFLQIGLGDAHAYDTYLKPMDTVAKSLTGADLAAVKSYTGSGYGSMNHALYGAAHEPTGAVKTSIDNLTKAIDKSALPTDLVLSRGLSVPEYSKAKPGTVLEHPNFFSTSTTATPAFSHHSTHLIIEAPKGTKALFAQNISSVGSHEREVIIQRGYKMLVLSNTKQGAKNIVRVRLLLDD